MIKLENAQPGTIVKVFKDPVTETNLEGKAVLVSNPGIGSGFVSNSKRLDTWVVKFLGEKERVYRQILVSGQFFG